MFVLCVCALCVCALRVCIVCVHRVCVFFAIFCAIFAVMSAPFMVKLGRPLFSPEPIVVTRLVIEGAAPWDLVSHSSTAAPAAASRVIKVSAVI